MSIRYTFLLWPHANARYRAEAQKLARAELEIMLSSCAPEVIAEPFEHLSLPALKLTAPQPLADSVVKRLRNHSLLYGLYQDDGNALLPIAGRAPYALGEDLPGILKYKGKTNELFTEMLINVCLYSAELKSPDETVRLLDPMCGRGTTLFIAANRGFDATGSDIDRPALKEGEQFFKRYLEYHRRKHVLTRESLTVSGKSAPCVRFSFDDQTLRFVTLDASDVRRCFGAGKFHMIVADLPYGVQHSTKRADAEQLLNRALPAWRDALAPGGAIAVSFNAQTAKREDILSAVERAELTPLTGGAYDNFSHWVEQAVTRDVVVAVKRAKSRR